MSTVPKGSTEMVGGTFRSIFALTTVVDVNAREDEVADRLTAGCPGPPIRLVGVVLSDQHGERAVARRTCSEASIAKLDTTRETDPAITAELECDG
ncbi:MAG: hypothetical protein ABIO83_03660 [Ilumatobacteraceae bacterium]